MLKFEGAWRFESPGRIPYGVISDFFDLIRKITTQGSTQRILEHFKSYFASAAGSTSSWSSSADWAETDLSTHMEEAAANAPLFIEAFYEACEVLRAKGIEVPSVRVINNTLSEHEAGFQVQPPNLVSLNPDVAPVEAPQVPSSLNEQAREIIQKSLHESERLLSEGRDRQAVQELLWLLETVSTAFQGVDTGSGTVQGKYFNKIVGDLRLHNKGTTLEQILSWTTTLHGFLSSPAGGGIRHGADLSSGIATRPTEARLFCNLIRSYVSFLIAEHARLTGH